MADYRCICLCGVGQIQDAEAAQLEQYVRQGGTVMVFMGDPVTAENYNATLYKHHLLPGPLTKRIMVSGDQTPRRFDFDPHRPLNRLLADFQDQEDTGMESAEVYSYWQMDLPADSTAERVLNFLPPDGAGESAGGSGDHGSFAGERAGGFLRDQRRSERRVDNVHAASGLSGADAHAAAGDDERRRIRG